MGPERQYGVTPPISTSLPTENERRCNDALIGELRAQGTFASQAETDQRKAVLDSLQIITDAFVKKAAELKDPRNSFLIREARGRVFTYGSFRLGVYGPGSDIDTLVVAPKYVTVNHYFDLFPDLLTQMAPPGSISDLTCVKEAFVPIIKFEYSDISIDLIFCSIATLTQLPSDREWSLANDSLLRGLNENEVRSVNGTRVTDEILHLVPEEHTFKMALRAIKLWAQRKAIYANIMGFPGGVAWAMMVARVCQLYPKATSALIIDKFFNLMLRWPWPQPVLLKDLEYQDSPPTRVAVWNPKIYDSDRNHKMPIITPSYPSMCATHNVNNSSMAVIRKELAKGAELTAAIMIGRRPWKDLFAKHTFFTRGFKYYLTVTSCSRTKDAQNTWSGFVESRVRFLVTKLECHPSISLARPFNKGYERVHRCRNEQEVDAVQNGSLEFLVEKGAEAIATKVKAELLVAQVDMENGGSTKAEDGRAPTAIRAEDGPLAKAKEAEESAQAARVKADEGSTHLQTEATADDGTRVKAEDEVEAMPSKAADKAWTDAANGTPTRSGTNGVRPSGEDEETVKAEDVGARSEEMEVYTTNHYIGLELAENAKSLDLSLEVNFFKRKLMAYELFDARLMCVSVQNLRATQLPDDVFEPGEVKPVKAKKKRVADGQPTGSQSNVKRMATVAG